MPKGLNRISEPKLSLYMHLNEDTKDDNKSNNNNNTMGEDPLFNYRQLKDMVSFDWMISLGEEVMSMEEFVKEIFNKKVDNGIVKVAEGSYIAIDHHEIGKLLSISVLLPLLLSSSISLIGIPSSLDR